MQKIKVLYFLDRFLHGGIQTFVLENVKYMDKSRVQIDFLVLDDGNEYELESVVKDRKCNLYKLKNIWIKKTTDYCKYYKTVNDFFKKHNDYQVIHLHSSSKNFLILALAKKYGIKVRIAHSHNIGFQTTSRLQVLLGNLLKFPLRYYSTHYFACSYLAGRWLFGEKIAKNNLTVVKNAVDIQKFKYNIDKSIKIKNELGLANNFVIGHVGRFTHQKNHKFLIEIFKEIVKEEKDARLLLVGTGPLECEIKEKVKALGIENEVKFLGYKKNVELYMQAMDVFLFPSEFEGLGLVLVEAQTAGLYCFTSKDVVPQEVRASSLLEYISLKEDAFYWAKRILNKKNFNRYSPLNDIKSAGYDIHDTSEFLQKFYIEQSKVSYNK